ncbi:MAG: hypothetical protein WDN24_09785 [Sphingomonas sp.]
MLRCLPVALLLAPLPAAAQDFECRNTAAETRCGDGACEVETQAFTPMQLSRKGARITLCAYSGCREGPILMRRARGALTLLFAEVRGSVPGAGAPESLAVIYDSAGRTAQMRWGGFANAMGCG